MAHDHGVVASDHFLVAHYLIRWPTNHCRVVTLYFLETHYQNDQPDPVTRQADHTLG